MIPDPSDSGQLTEPPLSRAASGLPSVCRPEASRWSRFLPLILIGSAALIVYFAFLHNERSIAGALGFSSDDAWVHFRFAQNLVSGHGFSYNADRPIAGSTAPLWTLICAAFLGVTGDPVLAGKTAGVIAWFFLLWGIFRAVADITTTSIAATGAALLTVVHQRVLWGALSGLEVMLCAAMIVWALVFHFRAADHPNRPYLVVTTLLVLAGLTRPELFAMIPLFWLDRWWLSRPPELSSNAIHREIITSVIVGIVLLSPYLAFNFWTTGHPLPLTFYAKISPTGLWAALASGPIHALGAIIGEGSRYLLRTYEFFLFTELPGIVGCWYLFWNLRDFPAPVQRKVRLLLLVPVSHLLVSAVFTGGLQGAFGRYMIFLFGLLNCSAVIAGWKWLQESRQPPRRFLVASALLTAAFIVPAVKAMIDVPLLSLFGVGMYPFVRSMSDSLRSALTSDQLLSGQTFAYLLAPILAGVGGVVWTIYPQKSRRWIVGLLWGGWAIIAFVGVLNWAPVCSWAVKNVNDMDVATGVWLDQNLPTTATVAINDIGAIGYYAGRRHIYDLMGLTEPEILPYRRRGEEGIWEYLTLKRPDYLAIFDTWFPTFAKHTDVLEKVHSIHAENYTLWGYHTMSIYRAHWDKESGKIP